MTKKEIKRIKRAHKNGALVEYFYQSTWIICSRYSESIDYELDVVYRIHPNYEPNYDKKGRRYLKPSELVEGEWYRKRGRGYIWDFKHDYNGDKIYYTHCIFNGQVFNAGFFQYSGTYVKLSKKQIKKAKRTLGIEKLTLNLDDEECVNFELKCDEFANDSIVPTVTVSNLNYKRLVKDECDVRAVSIPEFGIYFNCLYSDDIDKICNVMIESKLRLQ